MTIFVVLYIYLLIVATLSNAIKNLTRRRIFQVFSSAFGMWLVLTLRSPLCGIDLYNDAPGAVSYYSVFKDIQDYSFIDCFNFGLMMRSGMDVGWYIFNKIVSLFSLNFQILLAVTAFVQISLVSSIIYKYSSHIVLSFMVFFTMGIYLVSFSTLRQITALTITLYSFSYLMERKYIKYALLVGVATLVHFSAFLFFIMYPMSKFTLNRRRGLYALGLIIVSLPFLKVIFQTIATMLLGDLRSIDTDQGGAYTLFILYIIIYLMTLSLRADSIYNDYMRKLMLLAVAGQSLGVISTDHLTRVAFYFSVFFVLSIPQIIDKYIETKYRRVSILVLSVFLFSFFWYVSKDGYLRVVPYSFFWEINIV